MKAVIDFPADVSVRNEQIDANGQSRNLNKPGTAAGKWKNPSGFGIWIDVECKFSF